MRAIFDQYLFRSRKELDKVLDDQLLNEICKRVKIHKNRGKDEKLEILEFKIRRVAEFKRMIELEPYVKKRDKKVESKLQDMDAYLISRIQLKVPVD